MQNRALAIELTDCGADFNSLNLAVLSVPQRIFGFFAELATLVDSTAE